MLRGIDLPACADKDGPGRFVGYLQGADVDDDGGRLVERGLDDGIAQRRAVGGVDGALDRKDHQRVFAARVDGQGVGRLRRRVHWTRSRFRELIIAPTGGRCLASRSADIPNRYASCILSSGSMSCSSNSRP
ncbi:hypothetical protein MPSD_47470 [Mycobacterium pseudoshottsii JCM 15466]|nr:hypothetical protein MMSP_1537 [Mycobacterium sp. 012931]BBA90061.1 hypothetical protein MPSD_47470 [Mycobacterium pseudoshottsii JCM 15466]